MRRGVVRNLRLTDWDRALLDGTLGPAAQMAMSILTQMAEVYGAEQLIDITGAHIDSTIYIGEAGLEFAERRAELGARVAVPSTLNVSGVDEHHWEEWAVPGDWATNALRQMAAYQSMGCIPTWTCAPYQGYLTPRFGQQIAWGESNAIAYANSVLGARTNRYGDFMDICAAITGRVPKAGLHLKENRKGQILLRLVNIPPKLQEEASFYVALGHLMGNLVQDKVPVIEGLPVRATDDHLCDGSSDDATVGRVDDVTTLRSRLRFCGCGLHIYHAAPLRLR